jgi:hypothetical protein
MPTKHQGHRSSIKGGYYKSFADRLRMKKDAKVRDRKKRQAASHPITYAQNRLVRSLENHRSGEHHGQPIPGERTPAYHARGARRKAVRIRRRNESAMDKADRHAMDAAIKRIGETGD